MATSTVLQDVTTTASSVCGVSDESTLPEAALEPWDVAVISLYFIFILAVGLWAMFSAERGSVAGFFLAGRSMSWFPVGASLYSSNIGSGHFVGLAGTGAASGIAQGSFEWNAMVTLMMLGWLFAPVYIASGIVTTPEYLAKRFGGTRIQPFLSILSLFTYIFTKISADLFAGAIFIQEALGWRLYPSVLGLLAITALYTVTGGLKAVIYTDTAQTLIMLFGAFWMMVVSFQRIGGYENLEDCYFEAIPDQRPPNTTCGLPREDAFHVFRDPVNSDLPWPGMLFGITIIATWYWCTDQVIVQRTLAAKNLSHAKGGCVFAGFVKFTPMYMMVMVGMISRIVFPSKPLNLLVDISMVSFCLCIDLDQIACAVPEECDKVCGNPGGCTNYAYAKLVLLLMPTGLKGLLLSVMVAALMSSLTSVFNSASTLFTCDLWTKIRPKAKTRELMIVGRIFVLLMVLVSILWIPVVQKAASGRLFDYIQSVTSYFTPPITAIFILAVFWPRLNESGCFWSLVLGIIIGCLRFFFEVGVSAPVCGEPEYRPMILTKVHYLYFAILLFAISGFVAICVSLLTPPIPERCLIRLTWYTRNSKRRRIDLQEVEEFFAKKNRPAEEEEVEEERHSIDQEDRPWWKSLWASFCGLETTTEKLTKEEQETLEWAKIDIHEEKWPAVIVNIGALVMMAAGVFLFGFYA